MHDILVGVASESLNEVHVAALLIRCGGYFVKPLTCNRENDKDGVIDHAWQILQDAEDSLPCPAIQRFRASVRADSVFNGCIRGSKDGFPALFDQEGGSE